MEILNDLAELQRERQQIIAISDSIANDLRSLRAAQEAAKSPDQIEFLSIRHRRALQSFNRAQQRLRELNNKIKACNLQAQYEIQKQAKLARKARKKARAD